MLVGLHGRGLLLGRENSSWALFLLVFKAKSIHKTNFLNFSQFYKDSCALQN